MNKLLLGLGALVLLFLYWAGSTTPAHPGTSANRPAGCAYAASAGVTVSRVCQPQDAR